MNFFIFSLSGKLSISPSILKDNFANIVFFFFQHFKYIMPVSLLAC